MSQAKVFSVIGVSVSEIQLGPAVLADLNGEAEVVVVGVGRVPPHVQPGLPGGAVGRAEVGDVEPGDLGRKVSRAVTESDTLESSGVRRGSRVDSLTRYWTNRPGGDAARAAAGSVCSADQADQVSSGSPTLPRPAWNAIDVPAGESARQLSAPNRLTSLVS